MIVIDQFTMTFPVVDDLLLVAFLMETVKDADQETDGAGVKEDFLKALVFDIDIGSDGSWYECEDDEGDEDDKLEWCWRG